MFTLIKQKILKIDSKEITEQIQTFDLNTLFTTKRSSVLALLSASLHSSEKWILSQIMRLVTFIEHKDYIK